MISKYLKATKTALLAGRASHKNKNNRELLARRKALKQLIFSVSAIVGLTAVSRSLGFSQSSSKPKPPKPPKNPSPTKPKPDEEKEKEKEKEKNSKSSVD